MRQRSNASSRLRAPSPGFCGALLLIPLALIAVIAAGCGRGAEPARATAPEISLQTSPNPSVPAFVDVRGLAARDLSNLRGARLDDEAWQSLLRVTAGEGAPIGDAPPVQGRYAVTDGSITFTPRFPFDPGRAYRVTFDPARLPGAPPSAVVTAVVGLPARATTPTTVVTAVYPSADVVPENLLRIYIEFSAPMGNDVAREHVRILDGAGREVSIPFLPVDADLWNPDHTRCTVFFDPGRVKLGIRPNKELGRPLRAGQRYTLEISSDWRDADGQPLKAAYRRELRVGPPVERAIMLSSWRIQAPSAGTRDALAVTFPEPLDHAILARALRLETRDGRPIEGSIALEANDARWRFTPDTQWAGGDYNLVASSVLEDPAGNRIGSPFEAEGNANGGQAPDEFRVGFTVRPAAP